MAELIPGITYEQKIVTVAGYSDLAVNTEIDTQATAGWVVSQLIPNGSDLILLFSRQFETPALP
jgi:hypothetical protein